MYQHGVAVTSFFALFFLGLLNLCVSRLFSSQFIKKKSVALPVLMIVIKYTLNASLLYVLYIHSTLSSAWMSVGYLATIPLVFAWGLSLQKKLNS